MHPKESPPMTRRTFMQLAGASAATVALDLLSPGIAAAFPIGEGDPTPEADPIIEPFALPVFVSSLEKKIIVPEHQLIGKSTNLREEPKIPPVGEKSNVVMKLTAGHIVAIGESVVGPVDEKIWYKAQPRFHTLKPEEGVIAGIEGYIREDVQGTPIPAGDIPSQLTEYYTQLAKDAIPKSELGSFSAEKIVQVFTQNGGLGGSLELNQFIQKMYGIDPVGEETFTELAAAGNTELLIKVLTAMSVFNSRTTKPIEGTIETASGGEELIEGLKFTWSKTSEQNGNISWTSVPFQYEVTKSDGKSERMYLYQEGIINADGTRDMKGVLVGYDGLLELLGEEQAAAATKFSYMGQEVKQQENGEVTVDTPDEATMAVSSLIDNIYVKNLGIVRLPEDQDIKPHLKVDEEIGKTIYVDNTAVVLNPDNEQILQLYPTKKDGSVLWLPYVENETELDFGDPKKYAISINGHPEPYLPGHQFTNTYELNANGELKRSSFDVVTVIASKPYSREFPIEGGRSVILYMLDTAVPDKDGKWAQLAPAIVWADLSNQTSMQAIRNGLIYEDDMEIINGIPEYPPGALMDMNIFKKQIRTNDPNVEGPVETEEYKALRKKCLSLYKPGRGFAMSVHQYFHIASEDLTDLDDPLIAKLFIGQSLNDAYLGKENSLGVTPMGHKYLTGKPGTLAPEEGEIHDRIDPSLPDLTTIQNPVLGLVGSGVFFDVP